MDAPHLLPATGDALALLRRVERHVPLAPARVILALVRLSRMHVVGASWIDPPADTERDLRAGRAEEGRPDRLRVLVRDALVPLAETTPRGRPEAHAVAMVRCRRGRVVWLPSDLAWRSALMAEAELQQTVIAECYLVTEHGFRCHRATAAGMAPALAA